MRYSPAKHQVFSSWARLSNGTVMCCGDGTTTNSSVAVTVNLGAPANAITAGLNYTCAVMTIGGVMRWGYNSSGPMRVNGLPGWIICNKVLRSLVVFITRMFSR